MKKTAPLSAAQIRHFHTHGYLIIENLFSAAEAGFMRQIAQADPRVEAEARFNSNYDETTPDSNRGIDTRLVYTPNLAAADTYCAIAQSQRLIAPLEQIFDDKIRHYYHLKTLKNPQTGGWQYHQDYGYHYKEFFYPSFCSVMLALDPADRENGCLRVVKDSNQLGRLEHQSSGSQLIADPDRVRMALAEMEEIHCELEPGSALYFHGNMLHASDPNLSEQPRWALIYAFVAARNTVVPAALEKTLSPPLQGWSDEQVEAATRAHWEEIQAQGAEEAI